MELLNAQEYKQRVDEFYKKHDEYCDKLGNINREENRYCDTLSKEQEDTYFKEDENGLLINDIARGYEERRKALKEEYKGFDDYYGTDYGTILTQEVIDLFNYGDITKSLLEKANKMAGKKFSDTYDGKTTVYTFRYIFVTPDDLSWAGESEDGKWLYYTCVGRPHWIED